MAKTSIQRIAEVVANKHNRTQKEAEEFVQTLFQTINEGLDADKIVKFKGLGTFKVVGVKPRESVNVNTGERVVISGHDKVSFSPDASMKDLVNKPFAQFETVVLNDGVDFEAIDEQATEPTSQQEEVATQTPLQPETPKEPITANSSEKEEKTEIPLEVQFPKTKGESVENLKEESVTSIEEESEEERTSHRWRWIVAALCLLLVAAIAGYFYYDHIQQTSPACNEQQVVVKQQPAAKPKQSAANPEQPTDTLATFLKKINQDPRVKAGAYDIVGIDTIVTLRAGQTMESYCRHTLGRDMIVYFQALNGCDQMTEGQQLKVPSVRWRNR